MTSFVPTVLKAIATFSASAKEAAAKIHILLGSGACRWAESALAPPSAAAAGAAGAAAGVVGDGRRRHPGPLGRRSRSGERLLGQRRNLRQSRRAGRG
jgi:hypothetical protein